MRKENSEKQKEQKKQPYSLLIVISGDKMSPGAIKSLPKTIR